MRAECDREEFICPNCCACRPFSFCLLHPLFSLCLSPLLSNAPPPPPPSVSSTLGFDVYCPIISHWPRRGSGGVSSTGVDVYIYTLYGARFQPTAVTHKAKKRSHFLAPLRKQRKDHGSNRVVQSGSWTLNHNKQFFLTRPCSENRGREVGLVECWRRMGGELVWRDRMQGDREVDTNTNLTQKSLCVHKFFEVKVSFKLKRSRGHCVSHSVVSCRTTKTQRLLSTISTQKTSTRNPSLRRTRSWWSGPSGGSEASLPSPPSKTCTQWTGRRASVRTVALISENPCHFTWITLELVKKERIRSHFVILWRCLNAGSVRGLCFCGCLSKDRASPLLSPFKWAS